MIDFLNLNRDFQKTRHNEIVVHSMQLVEQSYRILLVADDTLRTLHVKRPTQKRRPGAWRFTRSEVWEERL